MNILRFECWTKATNFSLFDIFCCKQEIKKKLWIKSALKATQVDAKEDKIFMQNICLILHFQQFVCFSKRNLIFSSQFVSEDFILIAFLWKEVKGFKSAFLSRQIVIRSCFMCEMY